MSKTASLLLATVTVTVLALGAAPPAWAAPQRSDGGELLAVWNSPEFRRRLAESLVAETELEPRLGEADRELLIESFDAIAAERMEEAATMLEKRQGPAASAAIDFTLAYVRFLQERFEQAATGYREAVRKFPKFRRAWRNLGMLEIRLGEFEPAAASLTRVIELGGGDALTYGLLGFAWANLEKHVAAESAYRLAILLDPRAMDWQMGLARSLFKQKRFEAAAALLGALIEAEPERTELWLLQANAFAGMEKPLAAAENLELVDRLGGSTAASLSSLGDIYVNQALYGPAVDSYLKALALAARGEAASYVRAARVLAANGAHDETSRLVAGIEAAFGETLAAADRKELLKLRARLAVAAGGDEEQARILREIVALDPLDGEALLLLGQHHAAAGDDEQAIFLFERAAQLPDSEADACVRHAQVLVGQRRYGAALPLLRRAQAIRPRDNVQDYLEQVERAARTRS